MALRTAVADGLWSNAATWDTGVPGNGDTFSIPAGLTVTFDVDQSSLANGVSGAVNGTLRWATDGTVTYAKFNGDVTGTGSIYVGNSTSDPIPAPVGATPEVATVAFNGAYKFTGAFIHFEAYGEERAPGYAIANKMDNTHIVLDGGGMLNWLRVGDIIAISDSTVQGRHSPSSETFTVDNYDPATRTITLNAGTPLTRNVNQNGVTDMVILLSRCILMTNLSKAATLINAANNGVARGVRFYNFSYGALYGVTGWSIVNCTGQNSTYGSIASGGSNHVITNCTAHNNAYGGIANGGSSHIVTNCIGQNNAHSSIAHYGTSYTITNCTVQNSTYGGIAHYGTGHIITNCIGQNNSSGGIAYQGSGHTITNCTGQNSTYGGIVYSGTGHTITNCIGQNNSSGGIAYQGSGHTITGCTGQNNTNGGIANLGTVLDIIDSTADNTNTGGSLYNVQSASLRDCALTHTTEVYGYTDVSRRAHHIIESFDHDQVAGAFRAWTRGGVVNSVAAPVPAGHDMAYQHVCESATFPCWRRWAVSVQPGDKLTVYAHLRKDVSMAYLPRVQIVDRFADPLVDAANLPLDEAVMTNSVDTWENLTLVWENDGVAPRVVWIRTLAMNATGNMYAMLDWEVVNLEGALGRLIAIQDDIAAMETDVDAIQASTATIETDIDGIQSSMAAIESDIDAIQASTAAIETDVDAIQASTAAIETDIGGIQTDISAIQTDISGIGDDIASIKIDIIVIRGKVDTFGSAPVTVASPVTPGGGICLYVADDYDADEGRQLTFTDSSGTWPDLTGATVKLFITQILPDGVAGILYDPGTDHQRVEFELTAEQVHRYGVYNYAIVATLPVTMRTITLATGTCVISDRAPSV